ncbi:MAG: hypothetical protein ACE5HE_08810 [Phycisphaerae bacterium]
MGYRYDTMGRDTVELDRIALAWFEQMSEDDVEDIRQNGADGWVDGILLQEHLEWTDEAIEVARRIERLCGC